MTLMVIGTIAYDDIETPHGKVEKAIGGSAVHFAYGASLFGAVRLAGVIGNDFPRDHFDRLVARGVELTGVKRLDDTPTFAWSGRYAAETAEAETLQLHLNTLEKYTPDIPDSYRDSKFVFLANDVPANQLKVIDQMRAPGFTVCDTRDIWIQTHGDDLRRVLKQIDGIILNDHEAKILADETNLVRAAQSIQEMGADLVVIKKGENGAIMLFKGEWFLVPSFPVRVVKDPTGAGDSFAGGFMGHLNRVGKVDQGTLRQAMVWGTVVASMCVEDFSVDPLANATYADIERRRDHFLDQISVR